MIRVLHYVGIMKRGGMETFIMNLYRGVDKNKIQFDFAVHEAEHGDYDDEIETLGGKKYLFPHMRENPIRYRKQWRNFWKKYKNEYSAFHFHTNSLANVIALEEAYRAGVKIRIVHAHSSYANKGKLQILNNILHKIHQKQLRYLATDLFACSSKASKWEFGEKNKNFFEIKTLKNGINIKNFVYSEENRIKIRSELGLSDDILTIGHVAAFLEVKNHFFLIDIAKKMKQIREDFVFVLVGEGPLRDEFFSKVRDNSLENHFILTGVRSDVNCMLSAFDVLILPSLYEGLPVSLIEAQANGVPVILSSTIASDVKINENVYFCSILGGDAADEWANLIVDVNTNHINNELGIKQAGFDIEEVCRQYLEIICR